MKKSLFLLAAMGAAPMLWAQEPAVLPLSAENAPAAASAAVQQESLSALALLPQNTEAFIAVGNVDGFRKLAHLSVEEMNGAENVESCAIGLGAGSAASLHAAQPILRLLMSDESDSAPAEQWALHAHEVTASVIARLWEQHQQEEIDQAIAALGQWHLAPVTVVLTMHEEAQSMTADTLAQMLLQELRSEEGVEAVELGDWKGVRMGVPEETVDDVELTALQKVQLHDALKRVSLNVLCTVRDHSLVVVLCSDPAEAETAVSPVSSVLASEKLHFVLAAEKPLMAAYIPAALQNECRELHLQPVRSFTGFATSVFKTLAVQDAPALKTYQSAVEAVANLQTQAEAYAPLADAPITILAWEDGDLHMESSWDANGVRFVPTEHRTLPQSPDTIFTYQCDAMQRSVPFRCAELLKACETLADGVAETLNNEEREAAQSLLMQYRLFSAEQAVLGQAFTAWDNAFTGNVDMVVDGQGSIPASLLGGSPAQMTVCPRVAVAAALRSRAELENGRALFLQAVQQGMQKLGQDPSVTEDLPMTSAQDGDVTLHSVSLPFCSPGFSPSVAVTEKTWVLCSSAAHGVELAKSAPVAPAAEGKASFTFNTRPLATLLQQLQSALPEDADMAEAAQSTAAFADAVSGIDGTLTITPDDLMHLRVNVKLAR